MADRIVRKETQAKRDLIDSVMRKDLRSFIVHDIFRIVRPMVLNDRSRGAKESDRRAIHSLSGGVGDRAIFLVSRLWSLKQGKTFTMTNQQRRLLTTAPPSAQHFTDFEEASRNVDFIRNELQEHFEAPRDVEDELSEFDAESSEEDDDDDDDEDDDATENLVGETFYDETDIEQEFPFEIISQFDKDGVTLVETNDDDDAPWTYTYAKKRVDAKRQR